MPTSSTTTTTVEKLVEVIFGFVTKKETSEEPPSSLSLSLCSLCQPHTNTHSKLSYFTTIRNLLLSSLPTYLPTLFSQANMLQHSPSLFLFLSLEYTIPDSLLLPLPYTLTYASLSLSYTHFDSLIYSLSRTHATPPQEGSIKAIKSIAKKKKCRQWYKSLSDAINYSNKLTWPKRLQRFDAIFIWFLLKWNEKRASKFPSF